MMGNEARLREHENHGKPWACETVRPTGQCLPQPRPPDSAPSPPRGTVGGASLIEVPIPLSPARPFPLHREARYAAREFCVETNAFPWVSQGEICKWETMFTHGIFKRLKCL